MSIYPLSCAPLQGFTECYFRNIFLRHFSGVDKYYSPFIVTVKSDILNKTLFNDIQPIRNKNVSLVPQILTNNPDDMIKTTNYIKQLGYNLINFNFGCPFRMVVTKKRGAGILVFPEYINDLLKTAENSFDVSVKLRLGLNNYDDIDAIIPILNSYRIKEVIIHPRSAKDMYEKPVNLYKFGEILHKINSPVIYNGDIFSLSSYNKIIKLFPDIKGVMLGRGLLINPFLPEEIKTGSEVNLIEKKERFLLFFKELSDYFMSKYKGEKQTLGKLKSYWEYWGWKLHSKHNDKSDTTKEHF